MKSANTALPLEMTLNKTKNTTPAVMRNGRFSNEKNLMGFQLNDMNSLSFAPSGPISAIALILSVPAIFRGTRHEYEHVPPQPYSKFPD